MNIGHMIKYKGSNHSREEMSVGNEVFSDYLKDSSAFSFADETMRDMKLSSEIPRLPLFSRCPITNQARLEDPKVNLSFFKIVNLKHTVLLF